MNELQFIIEKIIDIDRRAVEIRKKTQNKESLMETELKEKVTQLEKEIIESAKNDAENKYNLSIKQAKEKAESIFQEAENYCDDLKLKYSKIDNNFINEIIKDIIKI